MFACDKKQLNSVVPEAFPISMFQRRSMLQSQPSRLHVLLFTLLGLTWKKEVKNEPLFVLLLDLLKFWRKVGLSH